MRAPNYLRKTKQGNFYFRIAIPKKFQALSDDIPREIRISLRTSLVSVAAAKARYISTLYQESFEQMSERKGNIPFDEVLKIFAENKAKALLEKEQRKKRNQYHLLNELQKLDPTATLDDDGNLISGQKRTEHLSKQITLSELIDKFMTERDRVSGWREKTREETFAKLQLFKRIVGDLPLTSLDYNAIRDYREIIQKLPPNLNKLPRYRDKAITEIIVMDNVEPMQLRTLEKNLEKVKTLLKWGYEQRYITENLVPILNVKVPSISADKKRDPFSLDDLKAIFLSDEMLGKAKKSLRNPYQFWVPVIALFTGARIEEICQLHVDDIFKEEKLWCISFNDQGEKRLKNQASKRVIPISSKLIELGLINYVQQCKKLNHERLFTELTRSRDGYSPIVSKWFASYKKRHGVHSSKKVFHSFRHTVIAHLQDKGYPEPKIASLVGHAHENVTFGVYGRGYSPASLHEIAEAVDFKLDHKLLIQAAKRFSPL